MDTFKKVPRHGLDSRRSWAVLAFASWVGFISTMSIPSSGVFYAAILDFFQVSPESASVPVTVSMSARFLGAILMGALCEVWPCQRVLLICSSLASFGIAICYFAPNVTFISCFLGVLHGCSLSGLSVALPVLICQYFKRWRTTACSLLPAPHCLNVFFAPQLANYFLTKYGTPELFLLLGAMSLNALPAVLAVGSPRWVTERVKNATDQECQPLTEQREGYISDNEHSGDHSRSEGEEETSLTCRKTSTNRCASELSATLSSEAIVDGRIFGRFNLKQVIRNSLKAFTSPTFVVDAMSFAVHVYSMTTFLTVHIDLPRDRGINPSGVIYLVYIHTIAEMVMRVLGGVLVDCGYISISGSMLFSFICGGVACEGLAWSTSMAALRVSSLLLGLSEGMVIGMIAPVLIRDFKDKSLPIMLGGVHFIVGIVLLTKPPVVGYFRNQVGSYSGLLHVLAVANALGAVAWFVRVAYFRRICAKTKKTNVGVSSRSSHERNLPDTSREMYNIVPFCATYAETWMGLQNVYT